MHQTLQFRGELSYEKRSATLSDGAGKALWQFRTIKQNIEAEENPIVLDSTMAGLYLLVAPLEEGKEEQWSECYLATLRGDG